MRERGARPDDLQPARELHGAPHRRLPGVEHVGRDLQRALLPREPAVSGSLHSGGDAAAEPRRRPGDLHPGAREVRRANTATSRINLNPDPSGGHWTSPPLSDRHWYPIYEKMVEYDIPAMIHVSTSCNPCFHTTGAHYLNADTTAFMQCLTSDLFKDFPTLRFVIPHGGGAVPYHWGRFRGLAQELKKPLLKDHLLNNIFFDTCVYHQPGIDLLTRVIPGRQYPVRERDDRRRARHRPRDRPLLRRHQALHRGRAVLIRSTGSRSTKATRGASTRGSMPH